MWSHRKQRKGQKSPLKAKPLRNPGSSLEQEIYERVLDKILHPLMIAFCFGTLAGFEWWRWYFDVPPKPVFFTVLGAGGIAYFLWSLYRERQHLARLRLGRDGERAVGQFLESLRAQGAHVFHDYPGDGFNLDHIVVHRSGIYVVETKTYSKPDRGDARITFDGQTVLVDGRPPDRDPVAQVAAGCTWLANLVRESTGRCFTPRPVLAFPGWYVQTTGNGNEGLVWAVEPKMIPPKLHAAPTVIEAADVRMIAGHLSRYARSVETNGSR